MSRGRIAQLGGAGGIAAGAALALIIILGGPRQVPAPAAPVPRATEPALYVFGHECPDAVTPEGRQACYKAFTPATALPIPLSSP